MELQNHSFFPCIQELLKKYQREKIFLRTNSKIGFPNREIERVVEYEDRCEVFVNFLGLQGSSSDLPSYILDLLVKNDDGSEGWSLYFDFFNHHILWLFYDVVTQKNYAKAIRQDFQDRISKILFSLLGFRGELELARTYLRFAPLIINSVRSKKYIESILQEAFGLQGRLKIIENIPHKTPISLNQRNKLGKANSQLGVNFMLGKTSLTHQTKIGILIEDLQYQEALEFFPVGRNYQILKEIIEFLTKNEFAIDLYLKIKFSHQMTFRLGGGVRLGWGSTLGEKREDSLITFLLHE
ncbi:type VI secretion system baseplate subunit TssG [Helicobacter sp. faydin-H23]|nr:type VI secretion system baseplate subunit TssG [Helicobacter kayseriensis]